MNKNTTLKKSAGQMNIDKYKATPIMIFQNFTFKNLVQAPLLIAEYLL